MTCADCGFDTGHTNWCPLLKNSAIRDAWNLVAGKPSGLDKQFLEEAHIAWE